MTDDNHNGQETEPEEYQLTPEEVAVLQLMYQRIGQAQAVLEAQHANLQLFQQWIAGKRPVQKGAVVSFDLDNKLLLVK